MYVSYIIYIRGAKSNTPYLYQSTDIPMTKFSPINTAYNAVFRPQKLSIGLVAPLEGYATAPVPTMTRHLERVRMAEHLGFAAVWLRNVPFNVPSFGDVGQ